MGERGTTAASFEVPVVDIGPEVDLTAHNDQARAAVAGRPGVRHPAADLRLGPEVLQVEAVCRCGRRATHDTRTPDDRMVLDGPQVAVADAWHVADGAAALPPEAVAYEVLRRRHHRSRTSRTVARAGLAETLPFEPSEVGA